MPLKKVQQWHDVDAEIENIIYELNGVKIIHSINPTTKDFVFSLIYKAGSAFEDLAGVPNGTAHFLEHMMMNPNDQFKSQAEIDLFTNGDKEKPEIFVNASTSKKEITFWGEGNHHGAARIIERIRSIAHYRDELFEEYIKNERDVIIAEKMREVKEEKNQHLNYTKFLIGDEVPQFAKTIIGDLQNIEKIKTEDLIKYKNLLFTKENVIISIQSKSELGADLTKEIEKLLNQIPEKSPNGMELNYNESVIPNFFKYSFFHDDHEEGVFIAFNYFSPVNRKIDYKDSVLNYLLRTLINKYCFDKLREEEQLVYGVETVNTLITMNTKLSGFRLSGNDQKFEQIVKSIKKMIDCGLEEYLTSPIGHKWFESVISRYIFPTTNRYDSDYAEAIATDILHNREPFIYAKAQDIAKELQLSDLIKYISESTYVQEPHIWIMSPGKSENYSPIIEKYFPV